MIPELLQNAYERNRPKETWETPPLSKDFFNTWQQEGLIPAFQCVQELVKKNGHDQTALRALGIIVGSAALATGLTQVVETFRADITDDHYSLFKRAGFVLYHASVGIIMAGQSPASVNEDRTYRITRNYDGTVEIVHGEGGMTEAEANEAIRRKLY
jgi:hypothetical protein